MSSNSVQMDLANVVLLLANFTGVDDIRQLSNNSAYIFTPPTNDEHAWLGELLDAPKGAILCLKFGEHIFSAEGWVFGSDPDTDIADVQLAVDNSTGVSKRHFRIDIHPTSYFPRVTVLSRSLNLANRGRPSRFTQNEHIEIKYPTVFDACGTTFIAWQPKLTCTQKASYRQRAIDCIQDANAAIPKYFPPLQTGPDTTMCNVRYGPNGKVYLFKSYAGKGSSASVMIVQERASGKIFAAKEPYYKISDDPGVRKNRWEELKQEYDHLLRLDRVSFSILDAAIMD